MWYKIFLVAWLIISVVVIIGFAMNKEAENKAYWEYKIAQDTATYAPLHGDVSKLAEWNLTWDAWLGEGMAFGMWLFVIPVVLVSLIKIAIKK